MNKFRTLTAREIECRVSRIDKYGKYLILLLYKDARCDQAILDETVGPMNWQRRHTRDNANCIVSIWDDDKRMWIEKEDTGTESNTEAEKGLASDSFKRACVNWGIGRELYTAPTIKITAPNANIKESNGKYACYDSFGVSEIGYNGHREINHLRIVNSYTGNVVFSFDDKAEDDPIPQPEPKANTVKTAVECERCGKVITGIVLDDGSTMSASDIIGQSKVKLNGVYCYECTKILTDKQPEAAKKAPKKVTADQRAYILDNANDEDYRAITAKYGENLERMTQTMAIRTIELIDAHNKSAS